MITSSNFVISFSLFNPFTVSLCYLQSFCIFWSTKKNFSGKHFSCHTVFLEIWIIQLFKNQSEFGPNFSHFSFKKKTHWKKKKLEKNAEKFSWIFQKTKKKNSPKKIFTKKFQRFSVEECYDLEISFSCLFTIQSLNKEKCMRKNTI